MMDTVIPRGPEAYLSIAGGANPNLELSSPYHTFPKYLKIAVMITQLRVTFDNPQSKTSGTKVLDILMVKGREYMLTFK